MSDTKKSSPEAQTTPQTDAYEPKTSEIGKGKSGGKKPLIILCAILVLLTVVCSSVAGGYFLWYVPQQEKKFVQDHKDSFDKITKDLDELQSNIDSESFSYFVAEDVDTFEKATDSNLEEVKNVKDAIQNEKNSLPNNSLVATDANTKLNAYYDESGKTVDEYQQMLEDIKAIIPPLKDFQAVVDDILANNYDEVTDAEIRAARDKLTESIAKIDKIQNDFDAIEVPDELFELKKVYGDYIKNFKDFVVVTEKVYTFQLDEGGTEAEYNDLLLEFDAAYTSFFDSLNQQQTKESEEAKKISDSFNDKFDGLSDKQKAAEDALAKLNP